MANRKPLIGITCRLDIRGNGDRWHYLQKEYSEAVFAAGGVPVLVPLLADAEYASAVVARLDGIVLSGSASDVDPARYGAEPHPKLGQVHAERDALDSAAIRQALERRLPLLGICYGTQMLNVTLGGTLHQHLETDIPHTDRESRHSIQVQEGSLLARFGRAGEQRVNTSHHQAIERVAPCLRVTATAPDGTVEAVETTDAGRFLIGVQWHPERIWQESELSAALFRELVKAAG